MTEIVTFFLDNFIVIAIIASGYYIYKQYTNLKSQTEGIKYIFDKTLNNYLDQKIKEALEIINKIANEYGHVDLINAEINRLKLMIDKGVEGTINEKVEASNFINKFKLNKNIELDRYPLLAELKNIGTFTEEDMESLDNGIAIARKEYNTQAFRYNEKANGFPMQYLTKLLKLNSQFLIFDKPRAKKYSELYEVFEEEEPEIDSLTSLNRDTEEDNLNKLMYKSANEIYEPPKKHRDLNDENE